jgi:sugar lactone lactonase YvrE
VNDTQQPKQSQRAQRVRLALAAVLVLLMLLLITTSYFLVQVLTPPGSKQAKARTPEGMTWIRSIYGFGSKPDAQLLAPNDTAIAPNGTIWVTDTQRSRLIGFNPDGSYRTMIHQGPSGSSPAAIGRPVGVDVDENGLIYVADYDTNRVRVFTPNNQAVRDWEVPLPTEVAVGTDRIAVATVNGIALFKKNGELITLLGRRGTGKDDFDIPKGVVFGPDGTLYVSDTLNNRLKAIDRQGKTLWINKYGPANAGEKAKAQEEGKGKGLLQMPAGLTMDAAGRLVLVDPFELVVAVVSPKDGKVIARYGELGDQDGQFLYPTGISYDPARDWFAVADTNNDRVQIIRIKGSGGGVLAALRRAAVGPVWVCCIPLILLLAAIVIIALRRRADKNRRHDSAEQQIPAEL